MYRATITAADGTTAVHMIDQDGWDELVDNQSLDFPVCVREHLRRGEWKVDAGWDYTPKAPAARDLAAEAATARREDSAAVAAVNDRNDRRDNRRSYYLRTGR